MCNSLLQDSEDTYLLDLNNPQAKLKQLQKQVATNEVEKFSLSNWEKVFYQNNC